MAHTVSFNQGSRRTSRRVNKSWTIKSISILLTKAKNVMNEVNAKNVKNENCSYLLLRIYWPTGMS